MSLFGSNDTNNSNNGGGDRQSSFYGTSGQFNFEDEIRRVFVTEAQSPQSRMSNYRSRILAILFCLVSILTIIAFGPSGILVVVTIFSLVSVFALRGVIYITIFGFITISWCVLLLFLIITKFINYVFVSWCFRDFCVPPTLWAVVCAFVVMWGLYTISRGLFVHLLVGYFFGRRVSPLIVPVVQKVSLFGLWGFLDVASLIAHGVDVFANRKSRVSYVTHVVTRILRATGYGDKIIAKMREHIESHSDEPYTISSFLSWVMPRMDKESYARVQFFNATCMAKKNLMSLGYELIEFFVWARKQWVGESNLDILVKNYLLETHSLLIKKIEHLSFDDKNALMRLSAESATIMARMAANELRHYNGSALASIIREVKRRAEAVESTILAYAPRRMPVTVFIQGPAGTGKSVLTNYLARFLSVLAHKEKVTASQCHAEIYPYAKNANARCDGFTSGHTVFLWHDIMQSTLSDVCAAEAMLYCGMADCNPYTPDVAEMLYKHKAAARVHAVVVSSNLQIHENTPDSGIRDVTAIIRRADFMLKLGKKMATRLSVDDDWTITLLSRRGDPVNRKVTLQELLRMVRADHTEKTIAHEAEDKFIDDSTARMLELSEPEKENVVGGFESHTDIRNIYDCSGLDEEEIYELAHQDDGYRRYIEDMAMRLADDLLIDAIFGPNPQTTEEETDVSSLEVFESHVKVKALGEGVILDEDDDSGEEAVEYVDPKIVAEMAAEEKEYQEHIAKTEVEFLEEMNPVVSPTWYDVVSGEDDIDEAVPREPSPLEETDERYNGPFDEKTFTSSSTGFTVGRGGPKYYVYQRGGEYYSTPEGMSWSEVFSWPEQKCFWTSGVGSVHAEYIHINNAPLQYRVMVGLSKVASNEVVFDFVQHFCYFATCLMVGSLYNIGLMWFLMFFVSPLSGFFTFLTVYLFFDRMFASQREPKFWVAFVLATTLTTIVTWKYVQSRRKQETNHLSNVMLMMLQKVDKDADEYIPDRDYTPEQKVEALELLSEIYTARQRIKRKKEGVTSEVEREERLRREQKQSEDVELVSGEIYTARQRVRRKKDKIASSEVEIVPIRDGDVGQAEYFLAQQKAKQELLLQSHLSYDKNALTVIDAVSFNQGLIQIETGDYLSSAQFVGLKNSIILINSHTRLSIVDDSKIRLWRPNVDVMYMGKDFLACFVKDLGNDRQLFNVPKLGMFRDITSHFIPSSYIPKNDTSVGVKVAMSHRHKDTRERIQSESLGYRWVSGAIQQQMNGVSLPIVTGFFEVNVESIPSYSGSLLFQFNPHEQNKVMGILLGGKSAGATIFAPVTQEELRGLPGDDLGNFEAFTGVELCDFDSFSLAVCDSCPPGFGFLGIAKQGNSVSRPTVFKKTPLGRVSAVTTAPAYTAPFLHEGRIVRPQDLFFAAGGDQPRVIDVSSLKYVIDEMVDCVQPPDRKLGAVLTDLQALNGEEGTMLHSLPQDTSAGFRLRKMCSGNGKWPYILDRERPDGSKELYLSRKAERDASFRCKRLLQGAIPILVSDSQKDETYELSKLHRKFRVVSTDDACNLFLMRKYVGSYMNSLRQSRPYRSSQVGIDATGPHWGLLYTSLSSYGQNAVPMDAKSWDLNLPYEVRLASVEAAIRWYARWFPDEGEGAIIRANLLRSYLVHYHLFNQLVYFRIGGTLTGFAMTAEDNGFCNELMDRYIFRVLCGHDKKWEQCVRAVYYGDDKMLVVRDAPEFNSITLAREAKKVFGITWTDDNKQAPDVPYVPLSECSFISRSFVEVVPGVVMGALSLDTIREMTYWVRSKDPSLDNEQWRQNCETSLREMVPYGREKFREWKETLNRALMVCGLPAVTLDYDEVIRGWNNRL